MINTKKTRVAVIGVGSLGQWHAKTYFNLKSAVLVGVYDINRKRAQEIASLYDCRVFDSLESLAGNVDAASIVVPTDKHYEIFRQLAEMGIHALVEKPIADSMEAAEEMINIADKKNLILQVGHIERFNPVMKFLEGNITAPRFIEAIRIAPYPPARYNAPPRGTEVSVVLDLMIHDIEIILHLVNSAISEIHAIGVPVLSKTEDIANARIVFSSGCVANITASRISSEKMRKIRVFQEDTYLSLDYMNQNGKLCHKSSAGIETVEVPIEKKEPLEAELESFINCVQTHNTPVVSGVEASRALRIAAEICEIIKRKPC